jgi:Predicted membrane protein
MKLSVSSVIPQNPVLLWLWITLLVWWSGLAGRDLFLVPALIFVGIYTYQIRNKQHSIITTKWTNSSYAKRWLISLFLVHVVLNLTITILKYYSFRWNVWDVGSYSNMLYNISQGRFYSSYLGTHNWGDHFSPSMSPLALFYLWVPSTHWVTLAKTVAYLSVPLLIHKICKESFHNKEQAWSVTVIFRSCMDAILCSRLEQSLL